MAEGSLGLMNMIQPSLCQPLKDFSKGPRYLHEDPRMFHLAEAFLGFIRAAAMAAKVSARPAAGAATMPGSSELTRLKLTNMHVYTQIESNLLQFHLTLSSLI